jgi:hypothetical protein
MDEATIKQILLEACTGITQVLPEGLNFVLVIRTPEQGAGWSCIASNTRDISFVTVLLQHAVKVSKLEPNRVFVKSKLN